MDGCNQLQAIPDSSCATYGAAYSRLKSRVCAAIQSKGFSGDQLVKEFEAQRYRVKKAVHPLLEEADRIADEAQPASRFDDVFGPEDQLR